MLPPVVDEHPDAGVRENPAVGLGEEVRLFEHVLGDVDDLDALHRGIQRGGVGGVADPEADDQDALRLVHVEKGEVRHGAHVSLRSDLGR